MAEVQPAGTLSAHHFVANGLIDLGTEDSGSGARFRFKFKEEPDETPTDGTLHTCTLNLNLNLPSVPASPTGQTDGRSGRNGRPGKVDRRGRYFTCTVIVRGLLPSRLGISTVSTPSA